MDFRCNPAAKTSDCSWPKLSELAWNTSACYSSSRAECQRQMWQFCFKWQNVVMSTAVEMALLDPRVLMGSSYDWGEKNKIKRHWTNEERGQDSHLMILAILMIHFPCNLRFDKIHTHIQKTNIWRETVTVDQLLHSNFGYRLDPSFFRLLDWFSEDITSHSSSVVWFVSQESFICLIRPWQAPFM